MRCLLLVPIFMLAACDRGSKASGSFDLGASLPAPDLEALPDLVARASDLAAGDDLASAPIVMGGGFVWQGFEHEWLRTVLGFAVPHRVSRLASFLDGELLTSAAPPTGTAQFHFGQDTGVDGNYMRPLGHYSALGGAVSVHRATLELEWSDDASGGEYPKAQSKRTALLEQPLAGITVAGGAPEVGTMVLAGLSLVTSCDDAKQPVGEPCNSDGMWPYRMSFAIGDCTMTATSLQCPLEVEINRAWTPNKGGLPPLEEKPFNDKLDFHVTIHYATWLGRKVDFVVATTLLTASGMGHDNDPKGGARTLMGAPGFAAATVGISRLGFLLGAADSAAKSNHLGRYIGALRFFAVPGAYRSATGELDVVWGTQVWLPDTVENATVDYELGVRLLSTRGEAAAAKTVEGRLCSDSKNAPFFSTWQRCDEPAYGPAQAEQVVGIGL